MPTNTPYTDLGAVKRALAVKNTNEDTWLSELLVEAQAAVDAYLGYSFQQDGTTQSPTTRVFDGGGTGTLWVDGCLALVQVQETWYNTYLGADGIWRTTATTTTDITADCYLLPANTLPAFEVARISDLGFYAGKRNYTIGGVWGYAGVPGDIARACTRLVVHWYKMLAANYSDTVADGQFGRKLRFVPEMPDDVTELLERHRHHSFYAR